MLAAALVAGSLAGAASAFTLHLSGLGNAGVEQDDTDALYASNSTGKDLLITQVGALASSAGEIQDLGLPALTEDGKVLFGAAFRDRSRNRLVWKLFRGDPDAIDDRVRPALDLDASAMAGCTPSLNSDPEPLSDGDGGVIFTGREAAGKDALFLFSGGRLSCIARVGDKTADAHVLNLIAFGSAQAAPGGQIVFLGSVEGERHALFLLSPGGHLSTLAVEGEAAPGGGVYRGPSRFGTPFGMPSVLRSPRGTVVAFTAYTSCGQGLFLYRDSRMRRVLSHGARSPLGPITYLARERPGLMCDGTVVLLSACRFRPVILKVDSDGRARVILRHGALTRSGTRLAGFGNPLLTGAGVVFIEGSDSENRQAIYTVTGHLQPSEVSSGLLRISGEFEPSPDVHKICVATLAINQRGRFAYLGGR